MELSDTSKGATGLIVDSNTLSLESVTDYLKDFSGVDIETLKVTNDFVKDGFYAISVMIYEKAFKFKLLSEGHEIREIVMVEPDGTENLNYQLASIGLDDRAKRLRESGSSANTPKEREKYDIRNFFKSTFFPKEEEIVTAVTTGTVAPTLTPKMQIFVQRELIEKDF